MINYLDIWYLDTKHVETFGKFLDYDTYKNYCKDITQFARNNNYNYCFEKIASNHVVIKLWSMKGGVRK